MKKQRIIRQAGIVLTGLAAVVFGGGGCPKVEKLPVNKVTFYEKDVQHDLNNIITPEITGFCAENADIIFTPLHIGDPKNVARPFDYQVIDNEIVFSDNDNSFYPCDEWWADVGVRNKYGIVTDRQRFAISYCDGFSTAELERLFNEQIDDINDRIDNLPKYVIGDGICSLGEPADSPDCVLTPPVESELEKLVDWACINLPRAPGVDTRIYQVTPVPSGFTYTENLELPISDPEYITINHRLPSNVEGAYWVAVAGLAWRNEKRMASGYNGDAVNPAECPSILILNSDKKSLIGGGLYSVGVGVYDSNGKFVPNYTEDDRVTP
jgi:hypothetical protein